MINDFDFIAVLKYKIPEEGGRKTPAFSGYRPHIMFPFADFRTSGRQIFINKDVVYPGETVEAEIKIVSTDFFADRLEEGMNFEFGEALHAIGTGTITKIVNEKLRKKP
jgi:translation elongation factor EF-Tu-like GTPase